MYSLCMYVCMYVCMSVCSIDAVYKVQDFLHVKRPADALAFLRAARYVIIA